MIADRLDAGQAMAEPALELTPSQSSAHHYRRVIDAAIGCRIAQSRAHMGAPGAAVAGIARHEVFGRESCYRRRATPGHSRCRSHFRAVPARCHVTEFLKIGRRIRPFLARLHRGAAEVPQCSIIIGRQLDFAAIHIGAGRWAADWPSSHGSGDARAFRFRRRAHFGAPFAHASQSAGPREAMAAIFPCNLRLGLGSLPAASPPAPDADMGIAGFDYAAGAYTDG